MHFSIYPKEPEVCDYFVYFDGEEALTEDECDTLIAWADSNDHTPGTIENGKIDQTIRNVDVYTLPVCDELMPIISKLALTASNANTYWWGYDIYHLSAMELLHYTPGGHYVEHMDWGPGHQTRKISVIAILSDPDDYEGGELFINRGGEKIRVPNDRGNIIVFPSWLLHGVSPITKGDRWVVTGWIQGPAFK